MRRETASFKQSGRAAGTGAMLGALGLLPDPVKNRAARLASSSRVFNLTVSNIPGPRFPLYMLGAELSEAYPVVPIAEQHSLAIGMFSYRDHMFFGLYADPETLPEVHEMPGSPGPGDHGTRAPAPPQAAGHGTSARRAGARYRMTNASWGPALRAAAWPRRPCS